MRLIDWSSSESVSSGIGTVCAIRRESFAILNTCDSDCRGGKGAASLRGGRRGVGDACEAGEGGDGGRAVTRALRIVELVAEPDNGEDRRRIIP